MRCYVYKQCLHSPLSYRGEVVAKASEKEEIVYGEVDLEFLESVRRQIPVTQQRRQDLYTLSSQITH